MGRRAHGFTLAELIVVLGIIMILFGLLVPALANSYSQTKLTRDMSLVRQHAAAIQMYTSDFEDVYPLLGFGRPFVDAAQWWVPMRDAGYFRHMAEIDPYADPSLEHSTFQMSIAMVANPDFMRPGSVPLGAEFYSSPIRSGAVIFPSAKGLELRTSDAVPDPYAFNGFDCDDIGAPWPAPISFCDGSAMSGTCRDFIHNDPFYTENGVGIPIISTWFGVRGRDR